MTSNIEWTDETWNPTTGCSKVSPGCAHCYAERDWERLSANPRTVYHSRSFTDVQIHPERLTHPLKWRKPRRIFVNSMSDLFHHKVPDRYLEQVFQVMAQADHHVYQLLTKRPQRMRSWILSSPWRDKPLPNVWLGASVEDQAAAEDRIPPLIDTPAAIRFLSCEPLLGSVDLGEYLLDQEGQEIAAQMVLADLDRCSRGGGDTWGEDSPSYTDHRVTCPDCRGSGKDPIGIESLKEHQQIQWVIVGGESGPQARPMHPEWARQIRDQCVDNQVAFHFKQWGEWSPGGKPHSEWITLSPDGCRGEIAGELRDGAILMSRVGKKQAGRELDGRTWDQFPHHKSPQQTELALGGGA